MSLWVLGTDTGVGKTVISAMILHRYGGEHRLAYWKPVSTGGNADRDRTTVAGIAPSSIAILDETYLLELPASPHLAARKENVVIDPQRLIGDLQRHVHGDPQRGVVIEGAGGVMVPLNDRGDRYIDVIAATGLPVVVVARSSLGTINHTLLTLEALRTRDVEVLGVVINGPPDPENCSAIRTFGEVAVLAEVPPLTGALSAALIAGAAEDFDADGILADWVR